MAVGMIARATHVAELPANTESELVIRFTYTDALGRVMMHKAQCEPNIIPAVPAIGNNPAIPEISRGWIGSGRTIYNNKGKAVMQYEPYFSTSHECDTEEQAAEDGAISPKVSYDPLGRAFRTGMPDGSFSENGWTSWEQSVWDANDTVLKSDWYKDRAVVGGVTGPLYNNIPERQAAIKAAAHAATPTRMYTDSLARPFYTVQLDGINDPIESYVEQDIQGNRLAVRDGMIVGGQHRVCLQK